MMRIRLVLFASSYSPLFLILAVRFEGTALRLTMAAIALGGALLLVAVLVAAQKGEAQPYRVVEVKERGSEVAGYIATYILPLIVLNQPTAEDFIAYAIFLIISGLVYVQSGMVHINPLVYLIGRRISTIRDGNNQELYIVHSEAIHAGDDIWASNVLETFLLKKLPALR